MEHAIDGATLAKIRATLKEIDGHRLTIEALEELVHRLVLIATGVDIRLTTCDLNLDEGVLRVSAQ